MKVLLLAGGIGTRLRPITNTIPKCLVSIRGKPLLEYWLEFLIKEGLGPILINLHYLRKQVEDYINQTPYKSHVKTVYEKKLLGTGGTMVANRDFLQGGTFMVAYADNLSKFNLQQFISHHENRPRYCQATMMTFKTPAPESCGIVELDEQGVVQAFHEKVKSPPSNLANAAVYLFEATIFNEFQKNLVYPIDISKDIIPQLLGKIYTYYNGFYHRDIGTIESLSLAQQES